MRTFTFTITTINKELTIEIEAWDMRGAYHTLHDWIDRKDCNVTGIYLHSHVGYA